MLVVKSFASPCLASFSLAALLGLCLYYSVTVPCRWALEYLVILIIEDKGCTVHDS